MTEPGDPLDQKLEHWRAQLIDLSLRNPLLNFSDRGQRTLRLLSPGPDIIFETLVKRSRQLTIFDASETGHDDGPEAVASPDKIRKGEVLVDGGTADLKKALLRLRISARTAVQEQGFNVSFRCVRSPKMEGERSIQGDIPGPTRARSCGAKAGDVFSTRSASFLSMTRSLSIRPCSTG